METLVRYTFTGLGFVVGFVASPEEVEASGQQHILGTLAGDGKADFW